MTLVNNLADNTQRVGNTNLSYWREGNPCLKEVFGFKKLINLSVNVDQGP